MYLRTYTQGTKLHFIDVSGTIVDAEFGHYEEAIDTN